MNGIFWLWNGLIDFILIPFGPTKEIKCLYRFLLGSVYVMHTPFKVMLVEVRVVTCFVFLYAKHL